MIKKFLILSIILLNSHICNCHKTQENTKQTTKTRTNGSFTSLDVSPGHLGALETRYLKVGPKATVSIQKFNKENPTALTKYNRLIIDPFDNIQIGSGYGDGKITIKNPTSIDYGKTFTANGPVVINGPVMLSNSLTVTDTLSVSKDLYLYGDLYINDKKINFDELSASIPNDIELDTALITEELNVTGSTNLYGQTAINNSLSINNTLSVGENFYLAGDLYIKDNKIDFDSLGVSIPEDLTAKTLSISEDLNVSGSTTTNALTSKGDILVEGDLILKGALLGLEEGYLSDVVKGNLTVKEDARILGNVHIYGTPNVTSEGDIEMPKSLIVNGDTTLEGDVTLANGYLRIYSNPRLTEEGKVSKEAGLQVHGESKFGGDVTITQGTLNILENTKYDDSGRPIFISDPGINCAGDIHCDSNLVALGKLDVTGDAQLTNINCDSLHANGDVHIIGGLDIGSAITINGDPLSVYQIGATGTDLTLSGTLNVLQSARIGGDISITGSINLFGDLTIGESSLKEFMDQESQTSKSFENLCLSGALMVCNDAHFYNNINILKDTTISGTATVNGNINVGGILTLNETKFDQNGTSTIGTNLYALKNLTVDGDTILNELLTVASSAQIDGNLNIDGELTVNGEPISSGGKASTEGTSLSLSDDLMVKGCTTLYGETKIYNKTNISGELSASSLETGEAVTSSVNTQTIDINNRHLLQLGINTSSTSGALSNGALIIKLDSMENDLPLYLDFHYEGDHTNWKIGSGISGKNLFVHMTIWVQSADVSTATASILEKQTYVNGTSHNIDIFSPCATVSGWPYEKIIKIKFPLAETASCSSTYGTLYCDIMGTHIESITIGDY